MKTTIKSKISLLKLVGSPISNNEALLIKDAPVAVQCMKESDIYMIGGKPEGSFTDIHLDDKKGIIRFNYSIEGKVIDSGGLDIRKIPWIRNTEEKFRLQAGKRAIEFVPGHEKNEDERILDRYTPERAVWLRSRFSPEIVGLDKYKELSIYDLLYVGIAKVGDSYNRLIERGHKTRMEILANEPQRFSGSRVSDETFLFFFKIESLLLSQIHPSHELIDDDFSPQIISPKKIVSDAEKAFVSLLQPKYNIIKFKSYPEGKDGLYESGLDSYGYSIAESLTFNTSHGKIRGNYNPSTIGIDNESDLIFIKENNVFFYSEEK